MKPADVRRRVKFYMKRAGLTQAEVADALGVKKQSVNQWVKGVSGLKLETLARLAKLCGTTLPEFLGPIPKPEKKPDEPSAVEATDDDERSAAAS